MDDNITDQASQRAGDLYSPEQPVRDFAEAVFVRPKMYTIGGSLEEVAAFLEGFYSGMAAHSREPAVLEKARRWTDFCAWAAERIEGAESFVWFHLFRAVRRSYPDDTAAFARLAELYIAFRREHEEVNIQAAQTSADLSSSDLATQLKTLKSLLRELEIAQAKGGFQDAADLEVRMKQVREQIALLEQQMVRSDNQ